MISTVSGDPKNYIRCAISISENLQIIKKSEKQKYDFFRYKINLEQG